MLSVLLAERIPIDICKQIQEYLVPFNANQHTIVYFCRYGILRGLDFLHKNKYIDKDSEIATICADLAVIKGHHDVVVWLYTHYGWKCTQYALAQTNNMIMVDWIKSQNAIHEYDNNTETPYVWDSNRKYKYNYIDLNSLNPIELTETLEEQIKKSMLRDNAPPSMSWVLYAKMMYPTQYLYVTYTHRDPYFLNRHISDTIFDIKIYNATYAYIYDDYYTFDPYKYELQKTENYYTIKGLTLDNPLFFGYRMPDIRTDGNIFECKRGFLPLGFMTEKIYNGLLSDEGYVTLLDNAVYAYGVGSGYYFLRY